MPGLPVHHQLPEFTQTHVHWLSDAIQLSHPLSSPSPPAFNLYQHQVFSNELVLRIRWPKYWSLSFSISPSNEYSGLISFRIDWLDLLAVQGTLKNLLQHDSSKASILQRSAFFIVQLSLNMSANLENPAMVTGLEKVNTHPKFQERAVLKNVQTTISYASKVILKILHARLQHYMNQELPDVQARFRKGRGIRDQTANIWWIIEKAREFQKNIYLCFIDYAKGFDYVDHNELWKTLR